MDKRFLAPLILAITVALLVFYLLKTTFLTQFLAVSVFFGPGMAISYGLTNPMFKPVAHLATLLIIELLSVILIYAILYRLPLEKRFENKLLDKVAVQIHTSRRNVVNVMQNVSDMFKKNFGDLGFYIALAFVSFAYGVYVAAAAAYFLRVKLKQAVISIAIGALVAIVFWWYLALGAIPFITPVLVFVLVTGLSAALMVYGWARENKVIRKISTGLLEKSGQFTRGILNNVDKMRPKGIDF